MPIVDRRMKAGADHAPSTLATMKPWPLNAVNPTAAAAACRKTTPLAPLKASLGTVLSVRTCLHRKLDSLTMNARLSLVHPVSIVMKGKAAWRRRAVGKAQKA